MTRLRVLTIAWWYPSEANPVAGVFVREHVRAAARDHDVAVLAMQPGAARGARPVRIADRVEEGVRTLRVVHRRLPGLVNPALYVPGAIAAVRRLVDDGFVPDVIHGHVFLSGLLARAVRPRSRVPLVLSEHWSGFQLGTLGAPARAAATAAFRAATIVCPVSESLRRAVAPYAPGARFEVVPNVVDTDLFGPADASGGRAGIPRVLFVGSMVEVKGIATLLRALALMRDGGRACDLELIGDGPGRADYEALAGRLGLADVATFTGARDKRYVADAMRNADVLALPSRTETFGTVVAEAMACGLPVVCSRVGALPELVDAAVGRLVAPGDTDGLAHALSQTLAERGRRDNAAVSVAARARFGRNAIADRWTWVYAEAMAQRASR